ncbi:MAG: hypothetical protein ACAH80_08680 [Alphaproteobacteria bacterium]
MTNFTLDMLKDAMKLVERAEPMPTMYVTAQARTQDGWNFPPSLHRSNRLHKKLLKRHGTQEKWKPAILHLPDGMMLVHPALWAQVKSQLKDPPARPAAPASPLISWRHGVRVIGDCCV